MVQPHFLPIPLASPQEYSGNATRFSTVSRLTGAVHVVCASFVHWPRCAYHAPILCYYYNWIVKPVPFFTKPEPAGIIKNSYRSVTALFEA